MQVYMHLRAIHVKTYTKLLEWKSRASSLPMSDFFSNLYGGIRQPDVVMNNGPLPPSSTMGGGYPAGFDGTPDGRIDYASSLLGDVSPYAYGEADRLSTQTAYLNVPHRTQRIIPSLDLPEAQPWNAGGSFFRLSHQVDDGDIAFVIRAMFSPYELVAEKKKYNRQGILYAVDPVVNLATVNYILHGLQRFGYDKENVSWHTMWQALGIDQHFAKKFPDGFSKAMTNVDRAINGTMSALLGNAAMTETQRDEEIKARFIAMAYMRYLRREVVDYLIKNIIRPFGVPTGSERQGGQHQGSNSAITWPVDFVTTLTIDGLVINLVNFWRHEDLNSGDDLMLYVEDRPFQEYMLSHHPKNVKKQVFPTLKAWEMPAAFAKMHEEYAGAISPAALAMDRIMETAFMAYEGAYSLDHDKNLEKPADGDSAKRNREAWEREAASYPGGAHGAKRQYIPGLDKTSIATAPHDTASMYDVIVKSMKLVAGMSKPDPENTSQSALYNIFQGMDNKNPDEVSRKLHRFITVKESIFQLVPGVSSSNSNGVREAVWRHGYWHIARSQVMTLSKSFECQYY